MSKPIEKITDIDIGDGQSELTPAVENLQAHEARRSGGREGLRKVLRGKQARHANSRKYSTNTENEEKTAVWRMFKIKPNTLDKNRPQKSSYFVVNASPDSRSAILPILNRPETLALAIKELLGLDPGDTVAVELHQGEEGKLCPSNILDKILSLINIQKVVTSTDDRDRVFFWQNIDNLIKNEIHVRVRRLRGLLPGSEVNDDDVAQLSKENKIDPEKIRRQIIASAMISRVHYRAAFNNQDSTEHQLPEELTLVSIKVNGNLVAKLALEIKSSEHTSSSSDKKIITGASSMPELYERLIRRLVKSIKFSYYHKDAINEQIFLAKLDELWQINDPQALAKRANLTPGQVFRHNRRHQS